MEYLKINNWIVPVELDSARWGVSFLGVVERGASGLLVDNRREPLTTLRVKTTPLPQRTADALAHLLIGEGHHISCVDGVTASSSLRPLTQADGGTSNLYWDFVPEDGYPGSIQCASGGLGLYYDAQLDGEWTVLFRASETSGQWTQRAVRSDGTTWSDGVMSTDVGAYGGTPGVVSVVNGVLRMRDISGGSATRLSDIVVLPWFATDEMLTAWTTWIEPFSELPFLVVEGSALDHPFGFNARGRVASEQVVQHGDRPNSIVLVDYGRDGIWQDAAVVVELELELFEERRGPPRARVHVIGDASNRDLCRGAMMTVTGLSLTPNTAGVVDAAKSNAAGGDAVFSASMDSTVEALSAAGTFGLAFSVRIDSNLAGLSMVASKWDEPSNAREWFVGVDNGALVLRVSSLDGTSFHEWASPASMIGADWTHVVVAFDGAPTLSQHRCFGAINNVVVPMARRATAGDVKATVAGSASVRLFAAPATGWSELVGALHDFSVLSRSLSYPECLRRLLRISEGKTPRVM